MVFGDKAGYLAILSIEDGKLIQEIKLGDNINSTPVVLDGRIYLGSTNAHFYCLGAKE